MFFFFFKQKTAYEMRISDWSSDVCSSDLFLAAHVAADRGLALVAGDDLHLGRLADHAHGRAHRLAREELQEVWHALAADLLVVGEAEMDRCREIVPIGRAHVLTPVTNAHPVCRLLLVKKTTSEHRRRCHTTPTTYQQLISQKPISHRSDKKPL